MSSLPHARGGVSLSTLDCFHSYQSSPRPWGCFPTRIIASSMLEVFPTPVGVFLYRTLGEPWS
ncbi:conserved hypothetical protein [methanotrophic bacterial endosymbiont of Bathymodiolus sp.]|nr:conserved hypothetical protein [methanotrophic bacterial endosymbiont of Bathymodiolus sp.]